MVVLVHWTYIAFVGTEECRVLPPGSIKQNFDFESSSIEDTTNLFWRYEYNLKDHLGNLRVTCRCAEKDELEQDDRYDGYKPRIVQQAHYDAWGMRLPLFQTEPKEQYKGQPEDRFKYNGKEYMKELGYYEYGFRIYDPTTARFTAVDPLAMDYPFKSSYDYAENSPIRFIDLDGLEKYDVLSIKKETDGLNFNGSVYIGAIVSDEIKLLGVGVGYTANAGSVKFSQKGSQFQLEWSAGVSLNIGGFNLGYEGTELLSPTDNNSNTREFTDTYSYGLPGVTWENITESETDEKLNISDQVNYTKTKIGHSMAKGGIGIVGEVNASFDYIDLQEEKGASDYEQSMVAPKDATNVVIPLKIKPD